MGKARKRVPDDRSSPSLEDQMRAFVKEHNRKFDIAELLVRMRLDAERVMEESPTLPPPTWRDAEGRPIAGPQVGATCTSPPMPPAVENALVLLGLIDRVHTCIDAGDAPAAAAHAIQADRAYQALLFRPTERAALYGMEKLYLWRGRWLDVPAAGKAIGRKLLACMGERDEVSARELMEAGGAESRSTLETQISRLRPALGRAGYSIDRDGDRYLVSYTGV